MRVKINGLTVEQCKELEEPCGKILKTLGVHQAAIELNMARSERVVISRNEED